MERLAVYAVAPSAKATAFDADDLPHEVGPVFFVQNGPFSALVGPAEGASEQPLDRRTALLRLVKHQQIVEAVLQELPLLPVKFATTLPSRDAVARFLGEGAAQFAATFEALGNRMQHEVTVSWDLNRVFAEIMQDAELTAMRDALSANPEAATEADRAAFGKRVKTALDARREQMQAIFKAAFAECTDQMVVQPVVEDQMVWGAALLLGETDEDLLDALLHRLDASFEGHLDFRCVGPMPPYSFASITVAQPDAVAINVARQELGRDTSVPVAAIKQAWHNLARIHHPDVLGGHAAPLPMQKLTDAYRTLNAYATHHQRRFGDAPIVFDADRVAEVLYISLPVLPSPARLRLAA